MPGRSDRHGDALQGGFHHVAARGTGEGARTSPVSRSSCGPDRLSAVCDGRACPAHSCRFTVAVPAECLAGSRDVALRRVRVLWRLAGDRSRDCCAPSDNSAGGRRWSLVVAEQFRFWRSCRSSGQPFRLSGAARHRENAALWSDFQCSPARAAAAIRRSCSSGQRRGA